MISEETMTSYPSLTEREAIEAWTRSFFKVADAMSLQPLLALYDDQASAQFGNLPVVNGRGEIEVLFKNWYALLESMDHSISLIDIAINPSTNFLSIYAISLVTYIVKGDVERIPISVPAVSVFRLKAPIGEFSSLEKIRGFEVYFDAGPLMQRVGIVAELVAREREG